MKKIILILLCFLNFHILQTLAIPNAKIKIFNYGQNGEQNSKSAITTIDLLNAEKIIEKSQSFFNEHIIQQIESSSKISSSEDFMAFMKNVYLKSGYRVEIELNNHQEIDNKIWKSGIIGMLDGTKFFSTTVVFRKNLQDERFKIFIDEKEDFAINNLKIARLTNFYLDKFMNYDIEYPNLDFKTLEKEELDDLESDLYYLIGKKLAENDINFFFIENYYSVSRGLKLAKNNYQKNFYIMFSLNLTKYVVSLALIYCIYQYYSDIYNFIKFILINSFDKAIEMSKSVIEDLDPDI